MTEDDIRTVCQRFLDRHKGLEAFKVVLIPSDEFPAQKAILADQVAGYIRGSETLFMLTDRIHKPVEIEQSLRHEIYGHAILDALPKANRERMLDEVHYALCKDPEFRKQYDKLVAREYGGEISHDTLEEYFARLSEGRIEVSFSEQLIATLRDIIRAACHKAKLHFPFNDLDVRHFLKREIGRIASGEHQLSSQNAEALMRNRPLLARLEDYEERLAAWKKENGLQKENQPKPMGSKTMAP